MKRIWPACLLAIVACGGDDEKIPPNIDAAAIDAAMFDARVIDAGPDAAPDAAIDAAIDAASVDASAADVNGCTLATAVDRTAAGAVRTVTFPSLAYTPPCLRIAVGQSVTWSGDFGSHPLRAGIVAGGTATPQPGGPIADTSSGSTATFAFPTAGIYPYYCAAHGVSSMMTGVVYVE